MKVIITLVAVLSMTGCSGITKNNTMNTLPDVLQVGHNLLERCDTIEPAPDSTQLLGTRRVNESVSLEAYQVPMGENSNQFKVHLLTRDIKGTPIDTLDLGEFHTVEYQGKPRLGGNRYYTRDAAVTFGDSCCFTQNVVMTLTSLYLKNHTLTEMWRVEWDNHYEIDSAGHFIFKGQQETYRSDPFNEPIVTEYMSRDLTDNTQN